MRFSSTIKLFLASVALAGLAVPRVAEACGGTFCDVPQPNPTPGNPPITMPVDQTGENIVFVMEQGKVEADIQIQYKGEAAKFAWILPVQALPEVSVGSQAVISMLLQATVPTYSYRTQFDFCGQLGGGIVGTGAGSTVTTGGTGGGPDPTGGPVVVFQKPVGSFDVTVLAGGTTPEVVQWLTDNQYQVPPNASSLLDGYVANHFLFVAVKLTGGKGIDEIHPLVVRYDGTKPCVPLRLTSVAAAENMGVRTFFLGRGRVAPSNYKHVVPNLLKLDWFNAATNYEDLISRAVDSPVANGKAFVTEYAGPTAIVGATMIASSSWDAAPFATSAPVAVVQLLEYQGLMTCINNSCTYANPLLLPMLRQYLPAPATLTVNGSTIIDPVAIEGYFYGCLACYQSHIDMAKWNGPAFAGDLSNRVIDPSRHADVLLQTWPYLTRMFTTLSPSEMDLDPEFIERDDLAGVGRISLTAIQRVTCQSKVGMDLPDGRSVALSGQQIWHGFGTDMPDAERVEEIQATGAPLLLKDNTATINAVLKTWNDSQGWPPPGGTGVGGTGTAGVGGTGTTGGPTGGSAGSGAASPTIDNGGCGCRAVGRQGTRPAVHQTAGPKPATSLPWALLGLVGIARTLRRRERTAI